MITTIVISLHSFVDLITNSSSEIFIAAENDAADTLKKLVNDLLLVGGSRFTADDLFTIEVKDSPGYEPEDQKYYEEDIGHRKTVIVVTPKVTDSEAAARAAKVLSTLTQLFFITERYNG